MLTRKSLILFFPQRQREEDEQYLAQLISEELADPNPAKKFLPDSSKGPAAVPSGLPDFRDGSLTPAGQARPGVKATVATLPPPPKKIALFSDNDDTAEPLVRIPMVVRGDVHGDVCVDNLLDVTLGALTDFHLAGMTSSSMYAVHAANMPECAHVSDRLAQQDTKSSTKKASNLEIFKETLRRYLFLPLCLCVSLILVLSLSFSLSLSLPMSGYLSGSVSSSP